MRSFQFIPNIFGMQKYARRRIKPKLVGSLVARRWSLVAGQANDGSPRRTSDK